MDRWQARLGLLSGRLAVLSLLVFSPIRVGAATDKTPSPEPRKAHEQAIGELKGMLAEYHQGKRDDNDGYAILHALSYHLAITGSQGTLEYEQYRQEMKALIKKHPEFRTDPPTEFREQREAKERDQQQEKEIATKAQQPFIPKDFRALGLYGYDRRAAIQYQNRLEFFELPESVSIGREHPRPNARMLLRDTASGRSYGHTEIGKTGLTPLKVVRFRHPIQLSRSGPMEWRFVWACDDLLARYSGSDAEEQKVLEKKYPKGFEWLDDSANFQTFCGAIDMDGKVLFELPQKQHLPDTVFDVGATSPDGKVVVVSVGEKVDLVDQEDGGIASFVKHIRQAIVWTYPDRVEVFDVKDADKVNAILKSHGFGGSGWPWIHD